MEITQEQKMFAGVIQKAWEDEQFKSSLMANPVAVFEEFTGHKINLPQGQTLVVKDQSDESTIYLNIPRKVDTDNLELTDEQLEMVAGGTDVLFWGGVGIGCAVAAAFIAGREAK